MSLTNRSTLQRKSSRRGAIVVMVAFCLTVLLVCAAISLDGGGLLEQRRRAQATADAAAMAAAESVFRNYPTDHGQDPNDAANDRGHEIAYANGFTDDGTNTIVTVHVSPEKYMGGPHKGETLPPGYAEVVVQRKQKRYFSAIIGSGSIPITARAVARGNWSPAFVGIHVLDLHEPSALRSTGGGAGQVTGGAAVIVNSDAPDAAVTTGGGTVTADNFSVVGGTSGGGFIGNMNTGMQPQPDPLRGIPQPNKSDYTTQSNGPKHYSNGNRTLSPGVYGGITITGQANVTMLPGIYYMDGGGFSFHGQGNLVANGVMIYNAPNSPSDGINLSGANGGSVSITPPTSGVYKGMTLFQNRSADHTMSISGNANFSVKGTFYTANGHMNVTGNGAAQIGSQYVSRTLDINGGGGMLIDYDADDVIPRRVLGLVE